MNLFNDIFTFYKKQKMYNQHDVDRMTFTEQNAIQIVPVPNQVQYIAHKALPYQSHDISDSYHICTCVLAHIIIMFLHRN